MLESLPVPVVLEGEASTEAIPQAWITDEDGQAIRDCAPSGPGKNVKALRLRWGREHSMENAVLFYETSRNEASEQFCEDIGRAVRFSWSRHSEMKNHQRWNSPMLSGHA